jgi:uncharacterized surface protein with fasciclin (FAS1) repeats
MQIKSLLALALLPGVLAQLANLTTVLSNNTDLSNLTNYLSSMPQFVSQLSNATNITILAPSNDAFSKFMNSSFSKMVGQGGNATILDLLNYHVLNGTHTSFSFNGTPAFIPTHLTSQDATNVTTGQRVEGIKSNNTLSFISGLLTNSTVTQADMNFTGGVIHVIDTLLTVPENVSTTALATGLTAVDGALQNTSLTDTIDTLQDVTVFAPSNAAFRSIGSALENASASDLANIVGYHVINGTVAYSTDLKDMQNLTAYNGENVTISIKNGSVFVNSAKVVTSNILVANGVMHVIDNVLNPANPSATPNATATTQTPAFTGASSITNVPFTSEVTGSAPVTVTSTPTVATVTSTSSSKAAAMPMRTGGFGTVAIVGAGVALFNGELF